MPLSICGSVPHPAGVPGPYNRSTPGQGQIANKPPFSFLHPPAPRAHYIEPGRHLAGSSSSIETRARHPRPAPTPTLHTPGHARYTPIIFQDLHQTTAHANDPTNRTVPDSRIENAAGHPPSETGDVQRHSTLTTNLAAFGTGLVPTAHQQPEQPLLRHQHHPQPGPIGS